MRKNYSIFFLIIFLCCPFALGDNTYSYYQSKKILLNQIYTDYKQTLYCQAFFNDKKEIIAPIGFDSSKIAYRSERMEVEHVVPAVVFGKQFSEWVEGHPLCVRKNNKPFKGRECAEKINPDFQKMYTDLYNLYPSIGSVNTLRDSSEFVEFPTIMPNFFGSCALKYADDKVEVPNYAKGIVARVYLYFEYTYPQYFKISDTMRAYVYKWNYQYPPNKWECTRTKRIEEITHKENLLVKNYCKQLDLW